jgi:hypothetical protein
MTNFEVLQEYEKAGVPLPSYEELQAIKEENARQKELIQRLGSDIEGLDIKKMLLIVEVNNLKGLLKECNDAFEKIQKNYGYDDSTIELSEPVQLKIEEALK